MVVSISWVLPRFCDKGNWHFEGLRFYNYPLLLGTKSTKEKYEEDNIYIMHESIDLIEGSNINGLKDFEYYKSEYNKLCLDK